MRRNDDPGDSTDLLLDAICNMFGLFIFVAMLVALLVSVRGPQIVADAERASRAEFEDPIVAAAEGELEALREALGRFDETGLLAEAALLESGRAAIAQAHAEIERRAGLAALLSSRAADEAARTRELAEELPDLEVEITRLEAELAAARGQLDLNVRTPRRRELEDRVPAQVVLARGRVFVVNDWSDPTAHPCDSWCTWNTDAVNPARSEAVVHYCWRAGGQHIDRTIALRGGIEVADAASLERDPRWRRALLGLSPQRHVISIKADPDSFDRFAALRAAIARRGFLYDASPVAIDPSTNLYLDTIREGGTRAQ
jgi:hypothetical protein